MFTRAPTNYGGDRRRPLTVVVGIVVGIYLLLTAAGTLWTDFLWFDSIGYRDVWLRNRGVSILLGVAGTSITFAILWFSFKLADRLSPRWAPFDLTEEEELIERLREWIDPRVRQIRFLVGGALALLLGLSVAAWRNEVFLFINAQSFGTDDPIFGTDLGFYLFRLPLLEVSVDWVFNVLALTTVVVVAAHYLNGGIRFDGRSHSVTRGAKIHVSAMLALVALVRAVSYRLDMYELLYSDNAEKFFGPGYTDINARLPALRLLLVIALIAAALFIANIFRQGWTLALVSVGAWLIVAIAAGVLYPAFVQRFQVAPNQLQREMPFITNNLSMTRAAYGLDQVEVRPFEASDNLTNEDIDANRLTIDNLRIWTTSVLPRTYQNFQELEPYYALPNVDTDRYMDGGSPRQVMIAVRELEEGNLPRDDWQNTRLFYTHGFGAVVNEANVVQSDGQPSFLLKDVPPVASVPSLNLTEPRVYFGETYEPGRPVIVKTGDQAQEIDIPLSGGGTQFNEYSGEAGVVIDNIWKRIAFAFRYRDLNLLISGQIRSDSRVLVERNVRQMAENVVPFLVVDSDSYPVIIDGSIKWVIDMYTTTSYYPYSQPLAQASLNRLSFDSSISADTNYLKNSIKAVVDANNGDITFYLVDQQDVLAEAWNQTYPGLFQPASEMPDGLVEHLRYPQDLFRLQSAIYLEYHVTDENELFSGNDAWSFPADPSTPSRTGADRLQGDFASIVDNTLQPLSEVLPYYLLTELPGEDNLSYLMLQPFNPREKRNMVSFLVVDSSPGTYGRIIDYRMPTGVLVDGTEQVGQRIEQDAEISQQLSLWRGDGSRVIKGDLLVVPIENSVVYFQPIYLEEEGGAFPEFRRVAVVFSDRVEWADSLDGALELVFGPLATDGDVPGAGAAPGGDSDGGGSDLGGGTASDSTVDELVMQARAAFDRANDALAAGDLAGYQRWIEEAERLIDEIGTLVGDSLDASLFEVS